MKKHQTAKYKKRHKKELANRKAKRLATQHPDTVPEEIHKAEEEILRAYEPEPDAKPMSPARRAFQDV